MCTNGLVHNRLWYLCCLYFPKASDTIWIYWRRCDCSRLPKTISKQICIATVLGRFQYRFYLPRPSRVYQLSLFQVPAHHLYSGRANWLISPYQDSFSTLLKICHWHLPVHPPQTRHSFQCDPDVKAVCIFLTFGRTKLPRLAFPCAIHDCDPVGLPIQLPLPQA